MRGLSAADVTPGPYLKNPEVGEEAGHVLSGPSTSTGWSPRSRSPGLSACAAAPQPAAGRARPVSYSELRTSKTFPELP